MGSTPRKVLMQDSSWNGYREVDLSLHKGSGVEKGPHDLEERGEDPKGSIQSLIALWKKPHFQGTHSKRSKELTGAIVDLCFQRLQWNLSVLDLFRARTIGPVQTSFHLNAQPSECFLLVKACHQFICQVQDAGMHWSSLQLVDQSAVDELGTTTDHAGMKGRQQRLDLNILLLDHLELVLQ